MSPGQQPDLVELGRAALADDPLAERGRRRVFDRSARSARPAPGSRRSGLEAPPAATGRSPRSPSDDLGQHPRSRRDREHLARVQRPLGRPAGQPLQVRQRSDQVARAARGSPAAPPATRRRRGAPRSPPGRAAAGSASAAASGRPSACASGRSRPAASPRAGRAAGSRSAPGCAGSPRPAPSTLRRRTARAGRAARPPPAASPRRTPGSRPSPGRPAAARPARGSRRPPSGSGVAAARPPGAARTTRAGAASARAPGGRRSASASAVPVDRPGSAPGTRPARAGPARPPAARRPPVLGPRSRESWPVLTSTNASPAPPRSTIAGGQEVVRSGRQQPVLDQRPRRDDPHDLAPDQPPGRHLADLVADRHPVAVLDQPRDVPLGGVVRHAGHRDALAPPDVAAGQHDLERLGDEPRVLVERLVEVAQTEEEDRVRMARLHLQVLPTNRGRRQVLGAEQTELIEVGLAHVVVGTRPPRMTLSARLFGGAVGRQYSTRVSPENAVSLLQQARQA